MLKVFDYTSLLNENTYKPFAFMKLYHASILGDWFFPEMKKKNKKLLNTTFLNYVQDKIDKEFKHYAIR